MQTIYKCLHFTLADNLNKTCNHSKRCELYYRNNCENYHDITHATASFQVYQQTTEPAS